MDPNIKQQWVAALRSGEYKQGMGALNLGGKMCCLGVLCDLAVKAGAEVSVMTEPDEVGYTTYDSRGAGLPYSVQHWAGVGSADPGVVSAVDDDGDEYEYSLADLNDDGVSFDQIADLIDWAL
jgi:hypothetical protein